MVLTPEGGSLRKMLPLFRVGLGGRFGSGRQWMSWITRDDHVGALLHLLSADVAGPVNLTAPGPVTNRTFTEVLGHVLHRPTVLPIPTRCVERSSSTIDAALNEAFSMLTRLWISASFSFAAW